MTFNEIKGNGTVVAALKGMVDTGKVPHAVMLHEEDAGGAFPICQAFLQYLFYGDETNAKISKMIHPDVHYIFPIQTHDKDTSVVHISEFRALATENPFFREQELYDRIGAEGKQTVINVNEANFICEKLAFNSLEGGYKAVVMFLPEKMNIAAANKLLKSLEEPEGKVVFILITHSPEKVLRTIDSRCLHIRVFPEGLPDLPEDSSVAEFREIFISLMDALVSRDLKSGLEIGEGLATLSSRERMKAFCSYASEAVRGIFLIQQGLGRIAGDSTASAYAGRCKKSFPRKALDIFGRAELLIERNVNPKILFTDMVDRLYLNV